MKKIDIEKAIYKNLGVLKYEQFYRIYNDGNVGSKYIADSLGINPINDYSKIERMYKELNVTGCDCKILTHEEEYDDDSFFPSTYPYEDECILCHTVYTKPRRQSMWIKEMDKERRMGHYNSIGDIKYTIYKRLLEYIKDFNDEEDINLFEVVKNLLKEDPYLLNQADIYFDDRKKENYRVLIITGSNNIKIGNNIVRPSYQKNSKKLIEKLTGESSVEFDILAPKDDEFYISGHNNKRYNYNTIEDINTFFNEINNERVEYDLVIDLSNIKEIEEIDGKYVVKDYDIKNKVDSDYFITFRNVENMTEEDILNDKDNHDQNEDVYYHDYKESISSFGKIYHVEDDVVKTTYGDHLVKRILDTLYDENKVKPNEKIEIPKRLSRRLSNR